jgi:hyaluronate lyase
MLSGKERTSVWQDTTSGSWGLTREATRLNDLAAAYLGATDRLACDLRGNPQLLRDILEGLETFAKRYNATTPWGVNWWDYEIGVPEKILPTLCLLGDAVPGTLRQGFLDAVEHFTSDPRRYYNKGFLSTGANRLWLCRVHLYRAAIEKNADRLALCRDAVVEPLRYVARDTQKPDKGVDGFFDDGSFIQHESIAFVAAYGYLLLESYAEVAGLLKNTRWELTDPAAQNVFAMIQRSFDPFVVRGETIATVLGRSMGSADYEGSKNTAMFLAAGARPLPLADAAQALRLKGGLKSWIAEDPTGSLVASAMGRADVSTLLAMKAVAADTSITPPRPRRGFQMFANMDRAVHRCGSFVAALAMNSTRMTTFESLWGANRRGWFQSEGLLLLYTPDIQRYRDGYWALVDPYRLPGTTVERFPRSEGDGGGANPGRRGGGEFVGGTDMDGVGVAAMHLKPRDGALEARKAWFFFGDQIVCLGTGTALVGHDGWADARLGDLDSSVVVLNDFLLIDELRHWKNSYTLDKPALRQALQSG